MRAPTADETLDARTSSAETSDDRPGVEGGAGSGSGRGRRTPPPAATGRGELIGRYLVLGTLGAGGMGIVYSAYDPELDRKVAIKLLAAQGQEGARVRMLREAQAMAQLDHPNVVRIYDVGTRDEQVFIAMEHVDGGTAKEWLEQPRPWREIVRVFEDVARGLAAAHAAGLVHRDVKPSNILLGKDGRARVTDFGVVRRADGPDEPPAANVPDDAAVSAAGGALATPLTQAGTVVGTPFYMAPEQLAGDPADARTDQYAFCVSLYEALYGTHPYPKLPDGERDTRLAEPPADSPVPGRIYRVLARGLAEARDQRFPSMAALLEALERDPAAARWRWLARGAAVAVAGAAVLGVAHARHHERLVCQGADQQLAGAWDPARRAAVATSFQATGAPYAADALAGVDRALDAYAGAWVAMRTDACQATRVRGEQSEELMDLRMACLDRRLVELRAQTALFAHADTEIVEHAVAAAQALPPLAACADRAALEAPVPLPVDPAARAKIAAVRAKVADARAQFDAGKYKDALATATAAAAAARATGYRPAEAEALTLLSNIQGHQDDAKGADATATEAILAADAGHEDALAAQAWTQRVWDVGYGEAHFPEAHELARFARAAIERAGDDPRYLATYDGILGNVLDMEGKYADAVASYKRELALREKALGPEHPDVAATLAAMGNALFDEGKYDEALAAHRRALAIREKVLGKSHPELAQSLEGLGICDLAMGKPADALPYLQRALAIRETALGKDNPAVATSLNNIGSALVDLHRYDEALAAQQRALAIRTAAFGPKHPRVATSLNNVGDVLLAMKRLPEALDYYQRALAMFESTLGPKHPNLAYPLTSIGEVELGLHAPDKAIAPLSRAVALREANQGDPSELAESRFALARALWDAAHGGTRARDRARARQLAGQAKDAVAALGDAGKEPLAEIAAWQAAHR